MVIFAQVITIVFCIGVGILFTWGLFITKKEKHTHTREQKLAAWANSKGWSFHSEKDKGIADRFTFFLCLKRGDCLPQDESQNHYGYNIIEGSIDNRKICAFDYCSTGKNYFSAVIIETDLHLKSLFIQPRYLVKNEFGRSENIQFESIEFNDQFLVFSSDRRWAYDVINQSTMSLLLRSSRFGIDFENHQIIAYRDRLFDTGDFEDALQLLTGILDSIPESVIQELKEQKVERQ